jgi:flagellar hook protein FlgE
MLRSMYSGISGMKNFQTKLDVIGNNIANVNTYGFKKGRVVFKDLISQSTSGTSAPTTNRGGVNAKQIGLGSQTAAIDTVQTSGSLQSTGRVLDLAISGDGFFQVAPSATNVDFTRTAQYSRAGNFYMDQDGYMVNSDGLYVVGFSATNTGTVAAIDPTKITPSTTFNNGTTNIPAVPSYTGTPAATLKYAPIKIPTDAKSMSIGSDGTINYVDNAGKLQWAGQLVMAKFPNAEGLEKAGANTFQATSNSGDVQLDLAGKSGIGTVQSGFLEMSNVDLSEEFTDMIVAQRGFQANSRIITTSDEILQELMSLKR